MAWLALMGFSDRVLIVWTVDIHVQARICPLSVVPRAIAATLGFHAEEVRHGSIPAGQCEQSGRRPNVQRHAGPRLEARGNRGVPKILQGRGWQFFGELVANEVQQAERLMAELKDCLTAR
jgi:hypothetical protein